MSFVAEYNGIVYAPGYFLASDVGVTYETREIAQDHENAQTGDFGQTYVPAGSVYPTNDASAEGIVFEDIDVTNGNMPGSVVTSGKVYADRLPVTLATTAQSALEALGFVFVDEAPAVTRPY